MAELAYPLDNKDYSAEDFQLFMCTRNSGVYAKESFNFDITGTNSLCIGKGIAWLSFEEFKGITYANTAQVILNFASADANNDRIDRVVIRYDKLQNTVRLEVIQGVAGARPTPPNITRNNNIYEISLYQVTIKRGSTSIASDNVLNEKLNSEVCGLMGDGITKIDTDGILAGIQTFKAEQQQAFLNWFNGVQAILNDNATANFASELQTAKGNITTLQSNVSTLQGNMTTAQSDISIINNKINILQARPEFRRVDVNGTVKSDGEYLQIYNVKDNIWEWVNTPNKLGIEYRTTRIYLDKSVYACKIDIPIANNGSINHILQDAQIILIDHTLRFKSNDGQYHLLLPYLDPQYPIYLSLRGRAVLIHKNTGWGDGRIYGTVYYTKGVPT